MDTFTFADMYSGFMKAWQTLLDGLDAFLSALFGTMGELLNLTPEQVANLPVGLQGVLDTPVIALGFSFAMVGILAYLLVIWFIP